MQDSNDLVLESTHKHKKTEEALPIFKRKLLGALSEFLAQELQLQVLASMADANDQISTSVMEKLAATVAAEPYESISSCFNLMMCLCPCIRFLHVC
ncbi:hypothetical protein PIB30_088104 [Stylosanthes scabra]|uniref:Uncharacterized protein n=1 Tax=Stylosanthes scabra TaxID=79078 RepID=A0ABU6STV3_9FABA|nr:hypothetical protein [Stylosanthes scabra]